MKGEHDNNSLVGGSLSQSDGAGEAKATSVTGKLDHYNNFRNVSNVRYNLKVDLKLLKFWSNSHFSVAKEEVIYRISSS